MLTNISQMRFELFPFRSPLLREWFRFSFQRDVLDVALKRKTKLFFLFLWVLRCFTSPGALLGPMYSVQDDAV